MNERRFAHFSRTMFAISAVLIAVLMLVRPASSSAQTVKSADLVGSWARQGEKEVRFTFRADSTVDAASNKGLMKGHWVLVGDTLVVADIEGMDRRVLSIKDKLLTMTRVEDSEGTGSKTRVYERVDSVKATPSKP